MNRLHRECFTQEDVVNAIREAIKRTEFKPPAKNPGHSDAFLRFKNVMHMVGVVRKVKGCDDSDCEKRLVEVLSAIWPSMPEEEQQLACKVFGVRYEPS